MKNYLAQYTALFRFINSTKNFFLKFKYPKVLIGRNSVLTKVTFEKYSSLGERVVLVNSKIGNHSYISRSGQIHNATIGRFCSIGPGVKIGLGIHPTDFISTHPVFYSLRKQSGATFSTDQKFIEELPIKIGHDVWIGANAIIMDGVNIGNGAIIAAGAVVTKSVRPYEIVGGVPAKHIRFRFSDDEIKKIQSIEWWNKDEEWLKKNVSMFLNKNEFLSLVSA